MRYLLVSILVLVVGCSTTINDGPLSEAGVYSVSDTEQTTVLRA